MISKKLKNFVYLLLIVQNSFHANCIDCMYGIKVGETDGWGDPPKGKVKVGDPCDYSCLRLEIDEIRDPNGVMRQFNFFLYYLNNFFISFLKRFTLFRHKTACAIFLYVLSWKLCFETFVHSN